MPPPIPDSNRKHHVQQHLHGIAEKVLGAEWRVLGRLLEHWPGIVGRMAEHACPASIMPLNNPQGKDTAKLMVRIPGALAPQFQMQEAVMRQRINQMIGYDYVVQIVFEHRVEA